MKEMGKYSQLLRNDQDIIGVGTIETEGYTVIKVSSESLKQILESMSIIAISECYIGVKKGSPLFLGSNSGNKMSGYFLAHRE